MIATEMVLDYVVWIYLALDKDRFWSGEHGNEHSSAV
jgi:hypothetical protein